MFQLIQNAVNQYVCQFYFVKKLKNCNKYTFDTIQHRIKFQIIKLFQGQFNFKLAANAQRLVLMFPLVISSLLPFNSLKVTILILHITFAKL